MENDLICRSPLGATHRLILLHGWGADADDLIQLGQELTRRVIGTKIELIAFRAPQDHPGGLGRQWYGLFPPDWSAVPTAIHSLKDRIKAICKEPISLQKTVILGFSQGGAMGLSVGSELPMAGLIGCSAFPHPNWTPPTNIPPILLFHGAKDDVVPINASTQLLASLKGNQKDSELVIFEGGHEIPSEALPKMQLALERGFV